MEAFGYGKDILFILSNDFGRMVFIMIFLTWGLVIVNLFLSMLLLVHKLFGEKKKK
jgi:hypothetical protein